MAKLCILVCHSFAAEVTAAIEAEQWQDVCVLDFPSTCGMGVFSWEAITTRLPQDISSVVLLGRSCLKDLPQPPLGFPPFETHVHELCFDLLAPREMVRELIDAGAYLMSDTWLHEWRMQLDKLAPDGTSITILRDLGISQFTHLDTGLLATGPEQRQQLSTYADLPVTRITLGIDLLRNTMARIVMQWRLRETEAQAAKDRMQLRQMQAEQYTALDLLMQLAQVQEEEDLFRKIEEIFQLFFAPGYYAFVRMDGHSVTATSEITEELLTLARVLDQPVQITPSGCGLLVRLQHDRRTTGVVIADALAFPEYRERYMGMARAIADISALALENMQTNKRLQAAEKMASLGVVVAGVAHEINTPVGVCLTAISTLDGKTSAMTAKFREQTMKHSDLASYLENTAKETQLVMNNLERIGRLIETFRKIAVGQNATKIERFNLRVLMMDVVSSFGSSLDHNYSVEIHCDGDLSLTSSKADWNSVLSNLLSNSLQHGFKDRSYGQIVMSASRTDAGVLLEYSDNGAGMDALIRQHIFDPFFTTDMQHGMGLGMHIVYNIVKYRFGGTIHCDGTVSQGVRFRILAKNG